MSFILMHARSDRPHIKSLKKICYILNKGIEKLKQ